MKHKGVVFSSLFAIPTRNGVYKGTNAHGEGCKIVNMGELFAYDVIVNQDMKRITMSEDELLKDGLCKNDLLFARRSLVEEGAGKVSIIGDITEPMTFESSIIRVRLDDSKCIPLFYYYWLKSPIGRGAISALVTGTNVKGIRASALKDIIVDYPPIIVQQQTAKVLKEYDDLIENNRKQIKLLEEAAQRLYKEWFVDLRFPGHEDMQIVDGVPEGWKIVSLDDVISKITTGLNPRKNFVLGKGNNFYVTIKNMGDNNIYLDDKCDKIDNEALEKINKRSDLRTGDILFSGIGTMGRVYLISIPTNNWNVSESVFTMRANERITNEYLYMVLLSDDMKSYCDQNAHGVAQRGIRMADLRAYKLLLPDDNILKKYTYISKPLIQKVQALQKQCKELTEARDRLLPKLMSGEIEL